MQPSFFTTIGAFFVSLIARVNLYSRARKNYISYEFCNKRMRSPPAATAFAIEGGTACGGAR